MSSAVNHPRSARYLNAFGGVWRLTARTFLVPSQAFSLLGLAAFVGLLAYTVANKGPAASFYDWAAGFFVLFLAPTIAFTASGGALRDDLKSTATDYVFTRPLPRALYVAFKFVAHTIVLQLSYLAVLAVALAVAQFKGVPDLWPLVPRLVLAQVLIITAASGFGFFFGALTGRYVTLGLAYGALVEVGIGRIPTQLGQLSMLRHGREILGSSGQSTMYDAGAAGSSAAVLLVFSLLTVALAAAVVHRREFAGDRAKEA